MAGLSYLQACFQSRAACSSQTNHGGEHHGASYVRFFYPLSGEQISWSHQLRNGFRELARISLSNCSTRCV
jgi:hypothetical protein